VTHEIFPLRSSITNDASCSVSHSKAESETNPSEPITIKRAVVETFENLFYRYMQHPEAKSLGPDGKPCKGDTRGLLGRAHIIAGKHRRIGKESDRRWEEGDDLESLIYIPVEYEQPGQEEGDPSLTRASERLIRKIKEIGIRKLVRSGLGLRILQKICRRTLLKSETLLHYRQRIDQYIGEASKRLSVAKPKPMLARKTHGPKTVGLAEKSSDD
jgi:hypothetical protein